MKTIVTVAGLVVVGVALAAAIVAAKREEAAPSIAVAPSVVATQSESSPAHEEAVVETMPKDKPAPTGLGFHWSEVESTDYGQYIKNLQATGCPKATINDIIIYELNALFAPRENPLKAQIAAFKAKLSTDTSVDAAISKQEFAARKQLRVVEEEKQKLIKELLGVEIPLDPIRGWHPRTYDRLEASLNTVPPGKRERVREIQEEYWEVSDYLNDKYQLRRTPEYLEEYKKINAVRKSKLEQTLGRQGADDYDMRTSGIASRLGTHLSGASVTPDEFREIFKLKNANEAPYGGSVRVNETEVGETPGVLQARQEAERKVGEILGPERYAAYQLAQDASFKPFADLGDRFGVSRDNLIQACRLQQQLVPTKQPKTMSAEDWQTYQASMKELLGEPAFNALQRGQNFSAMNQLLFP